MADFAHRLGLAGITVTDHLDCEKCVSETDFGHILKSMEDIDRASAASDNGFEILKGVEIADWIYNKKPAERCIEKCGFDFILASVHSASTGKRVTESFKSFKSFYTTTPDEDKRFMQLYVENLKYTAANADYDALAHLSYPLRYLNGMCKKNFSLDNYMSGFEDILKTVIKRGKAIEINTSGLAGDWHTTMPDIGLLKLYRSLGGHLITIGSDAHTAQRIGFGFGEAVEILKKAGFKACHVYKKRKPVALEF